MSRSGYVRLGVNSGHSSTISPCVPVGAPSDSRYTLMPGYSLLNTGLGFRDGPWDFSVWARNLTNEHYLQNVAVQAGNSGLVAGTPGDPRMGGVTLRATF
jgi:iron complex outermembrane receptor protein